jgi:predicted AAA+ superfamily ATPase
MQIHRDILDKLRIWKDLPVHKPVLLQGARQTGKTWVMRKFGQECFDHVAQFDFDENIELHKVFERTKDVQRLLKELALYVEAPLTPGKTLIIFDEIQECEAALNSLKYFCENAPQFHILAAGSLLGVAVKKKKMTLPVGKVTTLRMYPVTFQEFLHTSDHDTWEYVNNIVKAESLPEIILSRLILEYKRYLVCGGMPEAVVNLLENRGLREVDKTLQDILSLYELDFAKYAEARQIPKIHALWHSLPSQLAKENRKFIYNVVKNGARAREYEDGLLWLEEAGLIQRVFAVSKPGMPLSAYKDLAAFKVYAGDCGLLRRLAKIAPEIILGEHASYTEFRGAITENAVLQSLLPQCQDTPYYWSSGNRAEVDFLLQLPTDIVPVEVKSKHRVSGKSLSVYDKKFAPKRRVRFSLNNLQLNQGLLNCPLPMADWCVKLMN